MPSKDIVMEGGKQHHVRMLPSGRVRWPFKVMQIGDWLTLTTARDALAARHALRSFARRIQDRKFTVRQRMENDDEWVCRRVA